MRKIRKYFLTGATGFLGTHIVRLLLAEDKSVVYVLIRGSDNNDIQKKYENFVTATFGQFNQDIKERLIIVKGNLELENFGIKEPNLAKLRSEIEEIYHCAAITGFTVHLKIARRVNVLGTHNLLKFAQKLPRLNKVNYISTAFVVGNQCGKFFEKDSIKRGQKFNNFYEQSKYEAELLIEGYKGSGLRICIYRPSIIVGEYRTGATTNFKMFYEPLHFLSRGIFEAIPANPRTLHNIIPVDVAAKSIYILSRHSYGGEIYHVMSSNNSFLGPFFEAAGNYFGYTNPEFIPIEKFDMKKLSNIQRLILAPFISYFNYKMIFKSNETEKKLKEYNFFYPPINKKYYKKIFGFCRNVGFIKSGK